MAVSEAQSLLVVKGVIHNDSGPQAVLTAYRLR